MPILSELPWVQKKNNLPGSISDTTSLNGMFFSNNSSKRIESLKVKLYKKPDVSANSLQFVVNSLKENSNGGMDTLRYGAPIQIPCSKKGWCTINVDSLKLVVPNVFFVGIESVATPSKQLKTLNAAYLECPFGPAYHGNGYTQASFVNERWYNQCNGGALDSGGGV